MSEMSSHPTPPGKTRNCWPEDSIEMMNEMMREQSLALHDLFIELKDCAGPVAEWPAESLPYIRLALRAQSNARSAMVAVARTELAVRKGRAESEK